MPSYRHLFAPGRIGTLDLPNRLFQTAMGTNLAHRDGTISDDSIAFYAARAAGGAALVTMGVVGVSYPRGQVIAGQAAISDDRFLPGLCRITRAVHDQGGRISAQLHHGGTTSFWDMAAGREIPVPSLPRPAGVSGKGMLDFLLPEERAASGFPDIATPPRYTAMDAQRIEELIQNFADGAARAAEAGFDAIELHGGHTYLLNSFLSPAENHRIDDYGGTPEKRARLLREVIEAIRRRVGPDFPLLCKINAVEVLIDGGLTIEDAAVTARIAQAAGADAITVSAQHNSDLPRAMFSSYLPQTQSLLVPLAAAIRAAVSVPVVTAGRISPRAADRAIAEGRFDFMAMGRKQIADDRFAVHLRQGGPAAVRPCIYCYQCLSQAILNLPLRCSVNPEVGFEKEDRLAPAATRRRVVVVGGGPGGMEAARRLALRGHDVTLLEASSSLGGTARIAAIAYAPNGDLIAWQRRELARLGIDVRLGSRATVATIMALRPDAVIVATGAVRRAPDIPGKALPHVLDGEALRAMLLGAEAGGPGDDTKDGVKGGAGRRPTDILLRLLRGLGLAGKPALVRGGSRLWMPIGRRVVVIGGELVGLELAEFLHDRGRAVTVVDDIPQFGRGLSPARRAVMLDGMPLEGIGLHEGARALRIEADAVRFTSRSGDSVAVPADTVIVAKGARPDTALHDALMAAGLAVHPIGDCREIGYIGGAMGDAAAVAARI